VVVISRAHIVSAEAGHQSFNKCAAVPAPVSLIHQNSVSDPQPHDIHTHQGAHVALRGRDQSGGRTQGAAHLW
jgi:hypothetical protein